MYVWHRKPLKKIIQELEEIKKEISRLSEKVVDIDTVLTEDDREALKEAEEDLSAGKTMRLD